ncbi:MAG TPA: pyridoxamine 5'-phosphate oxidase family protein [Methylomirabilota bacterium]|nr:pyridoxamine 5'-phosphate oxidase family protein [Methylomirabilota bacterium]
MNSINKNQPEDNREDLQGAAAIKQIKAIIDKAKTCFFCTTVGGKALAGIRPMNIRDVDDQGNLWFLMANDSHAYQEVSATPQVTLLAQGSPHSDFLHITGEALVLRDPAKIDELWEPTLKTWFTEGKDDRRIAVVKVTPTGGYYWDTKHGNLVAGVKILVGALTGKTLDDSIEGTIQLGQRKTAR